MGSPEQLYFIALRWEDDITTSEEREALKAVVARLVGYPVRIACDPIAEDEYVDIMVQNTAKPGRGGFQDVLELQSSGAFGLVTEGAGARLRAIHAACDAYNVENSVEFMGDDDDDTISEEEAEDNTPTSDDD